MAKTPRGGMTEMVRAAAAWQRHTMAWNAMTLSAAEVIWRRNVMMALGTMSAAEATKMIMEKPAAFAKAAERAATTAARRKGTAAVSIAALQPVASAARANARRLSKKKR
ncbi:MAG: hypothetical protein AAF698_10425 [Pseudomonadota bacterium]